MAPGLRSLAKGQRCVASWDEDCVTMAVEAARDEWEPATTVDEAAASVQSAATIMNRQPRIQSPPNLMVKMISMAAIEATTSVGAVTTANRWRTNASPRRGPKAERPRSTAATSNTLT